MRPVRHTGCECWALQNARGGSVECSRTHGVRVLGPVRHTGPISHVRYRPLTGLYVCVAAYLYVWPHTFMCGRIPAGLYACVAAYLYVWPHTGRPLCTHTQTCMPWLSLYVRYRPVYVLYPGIPCLYLGIPEYRPAYIASKPALSATGLHARYIRLPYCNHNL